VEGWFGIECPRINFPHLDYEELEKIQNREAQLRPFFSSSSTVLVSCFYAEGQAGVPEPWRSGSGSDGAVLQFRPRLSAWMCFAFPWVYRLDPTERLGERMFFAI
jgi:hypothetical protein